MPDIPDADHGPQEYNPWGSLAEDEETNPEKRQAPEESPSKPETASEPESAPPDASRRVGAAILTRVGFESRHKTIVDSSYEQARKKGEKLPGGNTERRNYAYIARMESLIQEHGSDLEKRLWRLSASRLIINPDKITEAYWRSQEQILRDNGQGRELGHLEKHLLTKDIQDKQRESLASWSDYLGDEATPYPMWFKMFAWDGMSKMGVFDKEKRHFAKRDDHTVAPYPKLNPAVLAKVYETMSIVHGGESSNEPLPPELVALAKSGDFNGLYSHFLLEQKSIPKTPERTEDIEGSWIEYVPGEEEALASAAEGTPWCVASPAAGRSYLLHSKYDGAIDTPEEIAAATASSHAKFILFHLTDPETGQPSPTACASIRLDTDGNVAEISGLKENQALEDSLVPIVKEKVKTLPGGEAFLRRFADKKQLIALDRKLQTGEELTQEELEFIYEIHRPIEQLDTYGTDPRLIDLRAKYDADYAIKAGLDPEKVAKAYSLSELLKNIDVLTQNGVEINPDELANSILDPFQLSDNLEALINLGAHIDLEQLAINSYGYSVSKNIELYLKHTDVNFVLKHLDGFQIIQNIELLLKYGTDANSIVANLDDFQIVQNIELLLKCGADANSIVANLDDLWLNDNSFLDSLFKNVQNLDISIILPRLSNGSVYEFVEPLLTRGADIEYIISRLSDYEIGEKADVLLNHGADPNLVASRAQFIKDHLIQTYLEHGTDPSILLAKIIIIVDDSIIDLFIAHNANPRELLAHILEREHIIKHIDYFLSKGISHKEILGYFSPEQLSANLDFFISKGITREEISEYLNPTTPSLAEKHIAHASKFSTEQS